MKRKNIIRICGLGVCAAAVSAAMISGSRGVQASGHAKGSGLAGISLCMDEIYGQNENKFVRDSASELPVDEVIASALPEEENKVAATTFSDAPEGVEAEEEKGEEKTEEKGEEKTGNREEATVDEENEEEDGNQPLKTEEELESEEKEVKSKLENIGISIADTSVNIRKKPNTDAEIVASLKRGYKCDIKKTVGDWVKIESGNARGYIKAEYLARGFEAEKLIDRYATKFAVVTAATLNVRFDPTTDSRIATLVPMGERLQIKQTKKDWHEVIIGTDDATGEDITGWVADEFVKIKLKWQHAKTFEEIREEQEREARRQAAAAEALANQQAIREAYNRNLQNSRNAANNRTNNTGGGTVATQRNTWRNTGNNVKKQTTVSDSGNYSATGSNVANFALKFVGNPYVWGGTSLTRGADCSGFVKSVYANFGVNLNRTSAAQSSNGSSVSLGALQPGDLVFYAPSGRISHVAMYIGGGKVVHASTPRTGIIVSSVYHQTPYCARRIVR